MDFKAPIATRTIILAVCSFALAYFIFDREFLLAAIFLFIVIYQVRAVIRLFPGPTPHTPDAGGIVDAIRYDDMNAGFTSEKTDPFTLALIVKMNEALQKGGVNTEDKDSQSQFYRNIVLHVGIGLIIFKENGEIEIMNSAARRLLRVTRIRHLDELMETNEMLVNVIKRLRTGGRQLLRLKIGEEIIQLSLYAIEMTQRGENLKLISLQNIQSELEEKEMEAWQNLVRVLTHEIMNSVTPISSLAGTVEAELEGFMTGPANKRIGKDQLADIQLSLQTISKRSDGLIQFVKEFRSLSHIPKPKIQTVEVRSLLEEIAMLHKNESARQSISIAIEVQPDDLTILADKSMISQVLINLVKNGMQAFEESADKKITLKGYVNEKLRPVISVRDNGPGIDAEALDKVFIPFFTTKKSGSGIGLSLSRQIMRQHQGTLTVQSTVGEGTEFFLRF